MKWIKATDRTPDDWTKAITRHRGTWHKAYYSRAENGQHVFGVITPANRVYYVGMDKIEWLDESEQEPDQNPIQDKTERLFRVLPIENRQSIKDRVFEMVGNNCLYDAAYLLEAVGVDVLGEIEKLHEARNIRLERGIYSSARSENILRGVAERLMQYAKGIIENPLFTQAKATVPDQTRERVQDWTDLKDVIHELATVLRDLHDVQNGPPLERDREEYDAVMTRVVEVLDKVGY